MDRKTDSPLTNIVLGLEESEALDGMVERHQPIYDKFRSNPALKDALQGRWLGHALHPVLVMIPTGAWVSAVVLDFTTDDGGRAARRLTGFGVLTAVPAAVTGVAELTDAELPVQRVGMLHAISNVVGLGLQVGSWTARRHGTGKMARLLSMAGLAATAWAGYLGGHMAVGRKVGTRDRALEQHPL